MQDGLNNKTSRAAALAAASLLLAAAVLGVMWLPRLYARGDRMREELEASQPLSALAQDLAQSLARNGRTILFDWVGAASAATGAVLLAVAVRRRDAPAWVVVAAAPVAGALLCAAPEAVSRAAVPVLRLGVAAAAAVGWLVSARMLSGRLQYGVGCACLAAAALFFTWWEPPPPRPVPIARPLAMLRDELLGKLPGWTGEVRKLDPATEATLGADEYLNLNLAAPGGAPAVLVFVTYNANAMSQVPHVPWVCMVEGGYKLVEIRQDGVITGSVPGREIQANVILFEKGSGRERARALMMQYFRVGEEYTWNRQIARFLATSGSLRGSFLSQTQVSIWLPPGDAQDPLEKSSAAYRTGLLILDVLVPLLEREYYPDLGGQAPSPKPEARIKRQTSNSNWLLAVCCFIRDSGFGFRRFRRLRRPGFGLPPCRRRTRVPLHGRRRLIQHG
ncbi:MAG: exosortase-associated EpsI family protein [Planctomycetes bacterium]|nr:exosortase-associated EpsI family protein [Planctomycetota bacterium]